MNADDLLNQLRAHRNAIDVGLESIEDELERYRQMRETLDEAIALIENDALAPLLGAVRELYEASDGASNVPERLERTLGAGSDSSGDTRFPDRMGLSA